MSRASSMLGCKEFEDLSFFNQQNRRLTKIAAPRYIQSELRYSIFSAEEETLLKGYTLFCMVHAGWGTARVGSRNEAAEKRGFSA